MFESPGLTPYGKNENAGSRDSAKARQAQAQASAPEKRRGRRRCAFFVHPRSFPPPRALFPRTRRLFSTTRQHRADLIYRGKTQHIGAAARRRQILVHFCERCSFPISIFTLFPALSRNIKNLSCLCRSVEDFHF
jgi:hypothetical protein